MWENGEIVTALAYDQPIPGYGTKTTNNLRLWSSKASKGEFDFAKVRATASIVSNEPAKTDRPTVQCWRVRSVCGRSTTCRDHLGCSLPK